MQLVVPSLTVGGVAVIAAGVIAAAPAGPATAGVGALGTTPVVLTAAEDTALDSGALSTAEADFTTTAANYADLTGHAGELPLLHLTGLQTGYTNVAEEMLPVLLRGEQGFDADLAGDPSLQGLVNEVLFNPVNHGWETLADGAQTTSSALDAAVGSGTGIDAAEFSAELTNLSVAGDLLLDIPLLAVADLF